MSGPDLPDLLQFHKNTKAGINWLSDDLYFSAKLHLMMWNMEFNTLDGFLCICALYLGSLAQFPLFAMMPKYTKTVIYKTIIRYGLYTGVRLHLMLDLKLNTLYDFLFIHARDSGYLGPISLTCLNALSTLKHKSTLRWSLHLSNVSFDLKCGV